MRIHLRKFVFRLTAAVVFCLAMSFDTGSLATMTQPPCECLECGTCGTCVAVPSGGGWNCDCIETVPPETNCAYAGILSLDCDDCCTNVYPNPACVGQTVWFEVNLFNDGGSNSVTDTDVNCNRTTYVYHVGGGGITYSPSNVVTQTFNDPGTYSQTFTARARNGLFCDEITRSLTLQVPVVAVTGLAADQGQMVGVTDIVDWAESGVVTVTATPTPNLSPDDLPDCWDMEGGTEVSRTVHTVPKNVPCLTPIIASAGTSSKTVVVAVVKCQMSRFSRRPSCTLCWDFGHSWWEFVLLPSAAKPLVDDNPDVQTLINDLVGYCNSLPNSGTGPGEVEVGFQGAADCQRSWPVSFSHLRTGVDYSYNLQQSPGTYDWLSNNCTIQEEDAAGQAGLALCGCTSPRGLCDWLDSQ